MQDVHMKKVKIFVTSKTTRFEQNRIFLAKTPSYVGSSGLEIAGRVQRRLTMTGLCSSWSVVTSYVCPYVCLKPRRRMSSATAVSRLRR